MKNLIVVVKKTLRYSNVFFLQPYNRLGRNSVIRNIIMKSGLDIESTGMHYGGRSIGKLTGRLRFFRPVFFLPPPGGLFESSLFKWDSFLQSGPIWRPLFAASLRIFLYSPNFLPSFLSAVGKKSALGDHPLWPI